MNAWTELASRFRFHSQELRTLFERCPSAAWPRRVHPALDPPLFELGHLAATRRKMLRRMGHDLSLDAWEAAFTNGRLGDETHECPSPESLLEDFASSGEVLAAELEGMSYEDGRVDWGGKTPDGAQTLCGMLGFLATDEGRYLGRLDLLATLFEAEPHTAQSTFGA